MYLYCIGSISSVENIVDGQQIVFFLSPTICHLVNPSTLVQGSNSEIIGGEIKYLFYFEIQRLLIDWGNL
jgi:hypothetical protein